jgi:effector-binding domain-containing protein
MKPEEIQAVMGEAFGAIVSFIGRTGIAPVGPPLAVYRDWNNGTMQVDVGFPVAATDAAEATGLVKAGTTPSGKALKAIHKGPYITLRQTYGDLETHIRKIGMTMPKVAWEVYVSDPDRTPEKDLLTEIYMPVP